MNLNLNKLKVPSEENLQKLINLMVAMKSNSDIDLADYVTNEELTTTLEDYVLDDDITIYTEDDILALIGLSDEELEGLSQIIDDSQIVLNKTYSSSKIYSSIAQCLEDSKAYTLSELSKAISASYKVVTSVDQMTDSKVLYLLKDADSGMYNIYVFDEDTTSAELIGSFEINLDNFYTKTESEDLFATKADITANYATKTELQDAIDNATVEISEETDNLLEEKNDGLYVGKNYIPITQNEYNNLSDEDKQKEIFYYITDADASGLDIVSSLDSTATDNQVPSAKAVYNTYPIKSYVNLAQLNLASGCSTGDIYNALPSRSIFMLNVINASVMVSDVPETDGILIIHKHDNSRVDIMFKKSQASAVSENTMYLGSLKGSDGTGITWNRVCTTAVADVGKTKIEFNESNLGLTIIDNKSYYKVINGICYGVVELSVNAPTTDMNYGYVVINTNDLPKIGFSAKSILNVVEASSSITLVLDETTTVMRLHGNILAKEGTYIVEGSFCYPVAQS